MPKRTPEEYLGVYKTLGDVPTVRRFDAMNPASFPHENPWDAHWDDWPHSKSESTEQKNARAKREWTNFMNEQGRHYALADPEHVETWARSLLLNGGRGREDGRKPIVAYRFYLRPVASFYDWLMYHTEYRHAYNPVYMAASIPGSSARIPFEAYLEK